MCFTDFWENVNFCEKFTSFSLRSFYSSSQGLREEKSLFTFSGVSLSKPKSLLKFS